MKALRFDSAALGGYAQHERRERFPAKPFALSVASAKSKGGKRQRNLL